MTPNVTSGTNLIVKPEGLSSKAMLAVQAIKQMPVSIKSKKMATAAAKALNAHERAHKGRKNLLGSGQKVAGKPVSPVDIIAQVASAARTYHYDHTLPWETGAALLTGDKFEDYCANMDAFAERFNRLVDNSLIPAFPSLVEADRKLLGEDYDDSVYPNSPEELRSKYSFGYTFKPLDDADFRVKVSKEREGLLMKYADKRRAMLEERVKAAHRSIYDRLRKVVGVFYEKMSDPNAGFHNTIVSNITTTVEIAPSLDLHNDHRLTDICARILPLTLYDPVVLRKDLLLRPTAAADALAVLNQIDKALSEI